MKKVSPDHFYSKLMLYSYIVLTGWRAIYVCLRHMGDFTSLQERAEMNGWLYPYIIYKKQVVLRKSNDNSKIHMDR